MDAIGNVFGGVIVGWLLAQLADIWRRRRERKAEAAYLGATVLIQIERLIHGCASVAGDDGTTHGRPAGRTEDGQEYFVSQTEAPELSWDAVEVEWKSVKPSLMYAVLSLPLELAEAKDYLQGVREYDDPPYDGYIAARQRRFTELGVMAADLAATLRLETGIPSRPSREWNPESFLREQLKKLRDREEELARRQQSWPDFPAGGASQVPPPIAGQ